MRDADLIRLARLTVQKLEITNSMALNEIEALNKLFAAYDNRILELTEQVSIVEQDLATTSGQLATELENNNAEQAQIANLIAQRDTAQVNADKFTAEATTLREQLTAEAAEDASVEALLRTKATELGVDLDTPASPGDVIEGGVVN